MSELAEFARRIHETEIAADDLPLEPLEYPSKTERLYDIRAVVCDVYGTLINYWRKEYLPPQRKEEALIGYFRRVAESFGMEAALTAANPADAPGKTLRDFYHGLIALHHERAAKKGVKFSEVRIEKIWEFIVSLLKRHGYVPPLFRGENESDFSRRIAWLYNYHALGRRLYPGVVDAIRALKKKNIIAGLLSNAQFYTPIDLTLLIRDQSRGNVDDLLELFDPDLTFFSYEYGVAKPDLLLFRKLYDALYEFQILPRQTVFVGNDLSTDIAPAQEAGMRTALYTGDRRSAYLHDCCGKVIPDITFSCWTDLAERISFHTEERK